jgi:hypothetical protein
MTQVQRILHTVFIVSFMTPWLLSAERVASANAVTFTLVHAAPTAIAP